MTDITEQKVAEQDLANKEAQLHVALDNMPGALVYTDADLNIVVCNDRFKVPGAPGAVQPGRPYPGFLRYLAENGYYGEGDPKPRLPSGWRACATRRAGASRTTHPDGRCYRILRRRVARRRSR